MSGALGFDAAVFAGARAAGCSPREAEVLATYVVSDSLQATADRLGISEKTAKQHSTRLKRRLGVAHLAAAVAAVTRDKGRGS